MKTRIIRIAIALVVMIPSLGHAATLAELQAQLAALQQQIAILQTQLPQPPAAAAASCPNLSRNLAFGMRGSDVTQLQNFLISQGHLAPGNNTGYFGRLTESAVKKFQCKNMNICSGSTSSNGYGAVGPRTRAAITLSCSAGTATPSNLYNPNPYTPPTPTSPPTRPPSAIAPPVGIVPPNSSLISLPCSFNGQTIANGASVVAYKNPVASYGSSCISENRTCTNGNLSGTYSFGNCSATQARTNPSSLPHTIYPTVTIPLDRFVHDLFAVVLGRNVSGQEFINHFSTVQINPDRQAYLTQLLNSQEFQANATLKNAAEYIKRLYSYILKRQAQDWEVQNRSGAAGNPPNPAAWLGQYNEIAQSVEYRSANGVPSSYYDYNETVRSDAPSLDDLFAGRAHFQSNAEAQVVTLDLGGKEYNWDGKKMPILKDSATGKYYAFTRTFGAGSGFAITLLSSSDKGRSFTEVKKIFDPTTAGYSYYDAHVAVDHSVFPTLYIMTMECILPGRTSSGTVDTCVSESSDPFNPDSWTAPTVLVSGCSASTSNCGSARSRSASTPVLLTDGAIKYLSWTVVEEGMSTGVGDERAYSVGKAISGLGSQGNANSGTPLLNAEPNTHCTSTWDCNNRDKQDWKREGDYYYLIYNGANYYRCARPSGDSGGNQWGLSIARSISPLGPYTLLGQPLMLAEQKNTCGMSYNTIANIEGELYMYYSGYPANGYPNAYNGSNSYYLKRSKLVWN